jgi:DNA (cytosine-5)-methyltransferase 1
VSSRPPIRYGSVCSGIEAATAAWHPLGWEPQWFSEIEPFPSAVLAYHYPGVPNLGDMTRLPEHPIFHERTIDLLVGGTPCQDFSVAGLRNGLAGDRGNLSLVFFGLAAIARPRWIVWENVPGVLSSNHGRDFGSILGALAYLGYGFAYRVLDAQFFGVPQRRRRVFVVGYLGDWRRAAAVLFEPEGVRGDLAAGESAGEGIAGTLTGGARRSGGYSHDDIPLTAGTLLSNGKAAGSATQQDAESGMLIPIAFVQNSRNEVRLFGGDGQTVGALSAQPGAKQQCYLAYGGNNTSGPIEVHTALNAKGGSGRMDFESETFIAQPFTDVTDCLTAAYGTKWNGNASADNGSLFARSRGGVRRITPLEAERLQGFPDDYTLIPRKRMKPGRKLQVGKSYCEIDGQMWQMADDGPRYKALGNSMARPCMEWIGRRIQRVDNIKI